MLPQLLYQLEAQAAPCALVAIHYTSVSKHTDTQTKCYTVSAQHTNFNSLKPGSWSFPMKNTSQCCHPCSDRISGRDTSVQTANHSAPQYAPTPPPPALTLPHSPTPLSHTQKSNCSTRLCTHTRAPTCGAQEHQVWPQHRLDNGQGYGGRLINHQQLSLTQALCSVVGLDVLHRLQGHTQIHMCPMFHMQFYLCVQPVCVLRNTPKRACTMARSQCQGNATACQLQAVWKMRTRPKPE